MITNIIYQISNIGYKVCNLGYKISTNSDILYPI